MKSKYYRADVSFSVTIDEGARPDVLIKNSAGNMKLIRGMSSSHPLAAVYARLCAGPTQMAVLRVPDEVFDSIGEAPPPVMPSNDGFNALINAAFPFVEEKGR